MAVEVGTNSYVSNQEADDYFKTRVGGDAWAGYTAEQKDAALISATIQLDATCVWYGSKKDPNQALAFPRNYQETVPDQIKIAQMEIALSMSAAGTTDVQGDDPLTKLKAGDVEMEFKGVGGKTGGLYNDLTRRYLSMYGDCAFSGSGFKIVDVARAT